MRLVMATMMVALLAVPAQAQYMHGKKASHDQDNKSGEANKKQQDADRAYRAALDKQPNQKPADPWSKMR